MKKYTVSTLCCMMIMLLSAFKVQAQVRISGTVSDAEGPLMMCNVVEIDANNRNVEFAQTDINGDFSMTIKNTKDRLKISYIGCKTKIVPIGDQTVFEIILETENTIKEVTVVGKSRTRQGGLMIPENEISGARQTFDMQNVEGLAFTSADEALQGQIAGLDVAFNSGNLGGGTSMRLRGVTSINGSAEPLIVVDGNIFDNPDPSFDFSTANEETYASLLSINPGDIAKINVLKDASATAVWGSRGANGVIDITTKRGSRGPIKVDYSLRVQTSWQPKGYNLLSGDDYTMMLKEMYYNPYQDGSQNENINEINYRLGSWAEAHNWNQNTDWVDAVTQTGISQYHFMTITGGGEKATFRVSAGYDHEQGTIIKQTLDRFSTKLTLDYSVSDRITFRTTFPLTYTSNNKNYDDVTVTAGQANGISLLGRAQRMSPNMAIYRQVQDRNGNWGDSNEYYIMLPTGASYAAGSSVPGTSSLQLWDIRKMGNPVAIANEAWKKEQTYRISPEFQVDYALLGKDDDKTRLDYSGSVYLDIFTKSVPAYWPASLGFQSFEDAYKNANYQAWQSGSYDFTETEDYTSQSVTTRHRLVFTPHFKNTDWSLMMLGQWELTSSENNRQYVSSRYVDGSATSPTAGAALRGQSTGNGEGRSMSVLYQLHSSYLDGRYTFDFNIRGDGTTKFGGSNKWGFFPGVSGRWNISDEPFMRWSDKWLSMLSFRPSWGIVGRQPGSEYLQYARYASGGGYGMGNSIDPVSYLEDLQLDKLKWERTSSINLGADLGLFDNRLTADFNYYFKRTKDLLMENVDIPGYIGFDRLRWTNVGEMTNKGWELNVNLNDIVRVGKLRVSGNFNISQNFNEIVKMDDSVLESINDKWNPGDRGKFLNRIQEGNPLGSIYGLKFKGVYQYDYDWVMNQRTPDMSDADFADYINNKFLALGKTAPIAVGGDGKVLMDSRGNPIRQVYDFEKETGEPLYRFQGGDAIYEDVNHDGQINSLDIVYLGNSNPKVTGGFGLTVNYDQWTLRTSFNYRVGYKVSNGARMNLEEMFSAYNQSTAVNWRWRKNGDVTEIPRAMYNTAYNFLGSDRYVEDASFVRLNYVQLSYKFKQELIKKIGLRNLLVSVSGQNLLCWSRYSGTDPEKSAGAWGIAYDNSQTPRSKSVTVNLNVGF